MEDVLNHGTGYPARAVGFDAPAAGKTGTSRDGWFAGYTSNLLCVVWIGFDDNRDIDLTGGQTAAPIWGEFMKRAVALPAYRNTQDFEPPAGVVQETVDKRQSQPCAGPNSGAALGRKALEDISLHFRRKARTVILHRNLYILTDNLRR